MNNNAIIIIIIINIIMVVILMTTSLGSGAFHKEEANGYVSTGGQRNGVSCQ